MAPVQSERITRLLQDAPNDHASASELFAVVYDELRKIAQQRMNAERRDHTLDATALVHEVWLRLANDSKVAAKGRAHFFAAAAEAMRRILVEHARARGRVKRGAAGRTTESGPPAPRRLPLNVLSLAVDENSDWILSLDEAICRMEAEDSQLATIVRLRFYAGLSVADTAAALNLSPATVKRRWSFARARLYQMLEGADRSEA